MSCGEQSDVGTEEVLALFYYFGLFKAPAMSTWKDFPRGGPSVMKLPSSLLRAGLHAEASAHWRVCAPSTLQRLKTD